jgi:transcription elongation factor Elf1
MHPPRTRWDCLHQNCKPMDQIVFVSSKNTATFRCPSCGKTKTADVSQYALTDKKIVVKAVCACGQQFSCRLEKRKQYRKGADIPGKFTVIDNNQPRDSGLVKVIDISTTGLKLKMAVPRTFPIGTQLIVEFRLDDRKRTLLQKRVIVRNTSGFYVGASFHPNEPDDPALGFYLMP